MTLRYFIKSYTKTHRYMSNRLIRSLLISYNGYINCLTIPYNIRCYFITNLL